MNVNILFILVMAMYVWRISVAAKEGIIGEVGNLANICIVSFLVADAVAVINCVLEKRWYGFFVCLIAFILVSFGRKVIRWIFGLLGKLASIPVISNLNAFLGVLAGALEVTAAVWALYTFMPSINELLPGNTIMAMVERNRFLSFLYDNNHLQQMIDVIAKLVQEGIENLTTGG